MNRQKVGDVYKLHGTASMSMPADSTLEDVISTLVEKPSIRGIFLVDAKHRLVGMITKLSLIRWAHLNITGGKGRHEIPVADIFRIVDACKARDLSSGDWMALSVRETDTLEVALDKMLDHGEDAIPVLDSEGRVLGDLTLIEVLWWVRFQRRRGITQ